MRKTVLHSVISLLLALVLSEPVALGQGDTFGTIYKAWQLLRGGVKAYEALTITDEELASVMSRTMEKTPRMRSVPHQAPIRGVLPASQTD